MPNKNRTKCPVCQFKPKDCTEHAWKIQAPFNTDDYPKSVLVNIDEDSTCGHCHKALEDWATFTGAGSTLCRPAVIFQADIYCADCFPIAYTEDGTAAWTINGEPL